jgi:hypothetical protein
MKTKNVLANIVVGATKESDKDRHCSNFNDDLCVFGSTTGNVGECPCGFKLECGVVLALEEFDKAWYDTRVNDLLDGGFFSIDKSRRNCVVHSVCVAGSFPMTPCTMAGNCSSFEAVTLAWTAPDDGAASIMPWYVLSPDETSIPAAARPAGVADTAPPPI